MTLLLSTMGELRAGDLLQSVADGAGNNTSSRVASVTLHEMVGETFNPTVDVGHTFYVGQLKMWVHNTVPCDVSLYPMQEALATWQSSSSCRVWWEAL